MSVDLSSIADSLSELSIVDGAKLVKMLEEKWGISASAPVAVAQGAVAGGSASAGEEKSEFSVVLTNAGDKKIGVIKVLREVLGVGLQEAKAIADGAPKEVKGGVSKTEAEEIKKKLEEAGAKVDLK